jgi:hypothetical protein
VSSGALKGFGAEEAERHKVMKKCTYCGREYPNEATVCAIDQGQLVPAVRFVAIEKVSPIKFCPVCKGLFDDSTDWCPRDQRLLSEVPGSVRKDATKWLDAGFMIAFGFIFAALGLGLLLMTFLHDQAQFEENKKQHNPSPVVVVPQVYLLEGIASIAGLILAIKGLTTASRSTCDNGDSLRELCAKSGPEIAIAALVLGSKSGVSEEQINAIITERYLDVLPLVLGELERNNLLESRVETAGPTGRSRKVYVRGPADWPMHYRTSTRRDAVDSSGPANVS